MLASTYNPSTLGGRGRWIMRSRDWDHPGQHGEIPSLLKIQKISWAWWCVPVIPATREAEAGELPEPRRRRLRWAEIAPLHSSLGNKSETPSQKKKQRKKERNPKRSWFTNTNFVKSLTQSMRSFLNFFSRVKFELCTQSSIWFRLLNKIVYIATCQVLRRNIKY